MQPPRQRSRTELSCCTRGGSSGHLQGAAERGGSRSGANPDVSIDRARERAVFLAERTVVGAEIRKVGRRIVGGGVGRKPEIRYRDLEVVDRAVVDAVLNREAEEVAPRALPEIRVRRVESADARDSSAQIRLQF